MAIKTGAAGLEIHADLRPLRKELQDAVKELRAFNKEIVKGATGVKDPFVQPAKSVNSFTKALTGMRSALNSGIARIGAGFGLAAWTKEIFGAASSLTELDSKSQVVFGNSYDSIKNLSKETALEVGRAASAIQGYATDMGAVLKAFGISGPLLDDMSITLSKLAVDMASFRNSTDEEAFRALFSGMTGEVEPLKRFGIVMDENNLKIFAQEKGLKQAVTSMNQAQKSALRYEFILDKTKDAQGDAARTAETFANQTRRLQGEWKNLNEELGREITPVAASGLAVINDFLRNTFIPGVKLAMQAWSDFLALMGQQISGSARQDDAFERDFPNYIDRTKAKWDMMTTGGENLDPMVRDRIRRSYYDETLSGESMDTRTQDGYEVTDYTKDGKKSLAYKAPTGAKTLQEIINDLAGGTGNKKGGGGGKDAAKEARNLIQDILSAQEKQADANLDNVRLLREDLLLRQKLGVLTANEAKELERINSRLEFKDDVMKDLVDKWDKVQDKIKESSDKIADLRKQLKDMETEGAADRQKQLVDLFKLRAELENKAKTNQLSDEESKSYGDTLNQIDKARAGFSDSEFLQAQVGAEANLTPIEEQIAEEAQKRQELLDQIKAERDNMTTLKDESKQAQKEITDAVKERSIQTAATYRIIEENTKAHVSAMIGELTKLQRAYQGVGMSPLTIPDPGASNSVVNDNSSKSVVVNQNNYGEAATMRVDARRLQRMINSQL